MPIDAVWQYTFRLFFRNATLNNDKFQKVSTNLNNIMQLVCDNYITNAYACESYKMQVSSVISSSPQPHFNLENSRLDRTNDSWTIERIQRFAYRQ